MCLDRDLSEFETILKNSFDCININLFKLLIIFKKYDIGSTTLEERLNCLPTPSVENDITKLSYEKAFKGNINNSAGKRCHRSVPSS